MEASDKQVEGTGPLAGLRSVLPSEFELGARSAPAAYTVKLQVSDTQKTHASIIDDLIKSEGEAGEIPGRRTSWPATASVDRNICCIAGGFALAFAYAAVNL